MALTCSGSCRISSSSSGLCGITGLGTCCSLQSLAEVDEHVRAPVRALVKVVVRRRADGPVGIPVIGDPRREAEGLRAADDVAADRVVVSAAPADGAD